MKKVFWLSAVALLCVSFTVYAAEETKAAVKAEVKKAEAPAVTWADWRAAQKKADELDKAEKFLEAADAYSEYARIAVLLKDPVRSPILKAWGLNNAAYAIIKEHKKDQKGANAAELIKKAKTLVDEAKAVEGADADCKKCLTANDAYLIEWNAILNAAPGKTNSK
ncbi:MAG: hypothetical protein A2231_08080 [Candidatus Firestonebacteria bacterium RIFOXYA2_FULL_40_8]|nr:MAG: hypothetical protein A2231_08080 [Candidatus Firestonebacteria bacterium RIFOXYA2_FULL_40_8]